MQHLTEGLEPDRHIIAALQKVGRVVDIPHSSGPMSLTRRQKLLTIQLLPACIFGLASCKFVVTAVPTPNVS